MIDISMNVFRVLGDTSHTASKLLLMYAIHRNRSAQGVSLLTQILYMLVFTTRYLDLFWVRPQDSWYLFSLKIFYIASSAYLVFLMARVFPRSREKEYAWKLAVWSLIGSLAAAPFVCWLFEGARRVRVFETLWTFSIILESVCVLPQLLLLRQTNVPTVLDSYYLVTLGSYRFFYILNWIYRAAIAHDIGILIDTSGIFGIIQTALYIDFAWVYYSRQRVKLRAGGIVDADDLKKSFLVRRFITRKRNADGTEVEDDDEEDLDDGDDLLGRQEAGRVVAPQQGRGWGKRGISVRADDTLAGIDGFEDARDASDAQAVDPARFAVDDGDEEDEENGEENRTGAGHPALQSSSSSSSKQAVAPSQQVENSTSAWRDSSAK